MTLLVERLVSAHGLPWIDAASLDAWMALPGLGVVFFPGWLQNASETGDLAVILPELLKAYPGKLRGAVVTREAEADLAPRLGVLIQPSVVFVAGGGVLTVLPRTQDWGEYVSRMNAWLAV